MKKLPPRPITILLALLVALPACDEDGGNDIVVLNASGCQLARVTLDGVDTGPLESGERRELRDVPDGVHVVEGFRDPDDGEMCDHEETGYLGGDDDAYVQLDCACDMG